MQFIIPGVGGRLRCLAFAALIGLSTFSQAQVSLSALAKAVAETGTSVSSQGATDDPDGGSGTHSSSIASGIGAGSAKLRSSKGRGLAQQLQHAQVGSTTFGGDQKIVRPGESDQPSESSNPVTFAQSISSGASGNMGMSADDAEKLAERRQLAIGVAGGGGLFLFGVFLTSHITRSRRLAMSHHE